MEKIKADTNDPANPQKRSSEDNNEEIVVQIKKKRTFNTKPFEAQEICNRCSKKCASKINISRQKKLYNSFHSRSHSEQTLQIRSLVKRTPKKSASIKAQNPSTSLKEKKYDYRYSVTDEEGIEQEVCSYFFKKCFQISPNRIQFALFTSERNPNAVKFLRRCPPVNKTSEEDTKNVLSFIDLFPKYESNYSRTSSDIKLLHPDLNVNKLFSEYKLTCDQKQQRAVCWGVFRSIFKTKAKLRFKRFLNTCKTCSYCAEQLQRDLPKNEQVQIKKRRDQHKEQAENKNSEFNSDVIMATESEKSSLILTFGLQRALETPSLTSTAAFYKRPLWTYNLCIYDEVETQAYMYVWNESIASKRALEIGSCLLYHLKHYMPSTTENIIFYTNSSSSQRRNIKMALLLKHFLLSTLSIVKTMKQKFFNSDHSYNSCDRCFALIEKKKKRHEVVATTDDWINILCAARRTKRYVVTKMESGDFFTSKSLHRKFNVNSRKSSKSETNFDWFCVREISQSLDTPLNLIFTCKNGSTKEIDLKDRNMSKEDFKMANLEVMHPLGKAISKSKYMDLMQLKTHIPENCWNFYESLRYDATIEKDFGLASDSSDVEN